MGLSLKKKILTADQGQDLSERRRQLGANFYGDNDRTHFFVAHSC